MKIYEHLLDVCFVWPFYVALSIGKIDPQVPSSINLSEPSLLRQQSKVRMHSYDRVMALECTLMTG